MVGDPVTPNIVKPITVLDDYTYTRNYQADVIIIDESYNAPSNYISPVSCLHLTSNTYQNCTNITSVNLHNVPFVNNDMSNAFWNCFNLTSVTGINENVTNMTLSFWNCFNLVNAPIIPNSVTSMDETFYKCYNLVNSPVIPNSVINMFGTFASCSNLVNAPVIPNNVTNMAATFAACSNLVNAPVIPNSVTDMFGTFDECINLVNAPVIPNSITDMAFTFYQCSNLVNSPVIPNSVINMYNAFYNCTNLTGNMYIQSENITDATNCFNQTSLTKNVYIPFIYSNGVNTVTYNSFINAGYDTIGTTNGVYLKDINAVTQVINGILSLTPKYLDVYSGYSVTNYVVKDSDNNILFESDGSMGTQNISFNISKNIIISNLISGTPATTGLGCWGYTENGCTVTPTGSGYYSQLELSNFITNTPSIEVVWGYGPVSSGGPSGPVK